MVCEDIFNVYKEIHKSIIIWSVLIYLQLINYQKNIQNVFLSIEKFSIITQNVDGLHQRGGSSLDKVYEIHGNSRTMRCSLECSKEVYDLPKDIVIKKIDQDLKDEDWDKLECPKCSATMRPNILWFDEYYNERLYKVDSTMRIAKNTGVLVVIGTSGSTTLPLRLIEQTLKHGGYVLDVNLEDNNITKLIEGKKRAVNYRMTSDSFLSEFHSILGEHIQ